MRIIHILLYTHSFLFILRSLGNTFQDIKPLDAFTIHNPTFVPAYHCCYILFPTFTHKNIIDMYFVEMTVYYAVMQTLTLHFLHWLTSLRLTWLSALYLSVYFNKYISDFASKLPVCKISRNPSYVFIYCVLLISLQQNGPSIDFIDYSHFQALVIGDVLDWTHLKLWSHQTQYLLTRQKQSSMS